VGELRLASNGSSPQRLVSVQAALAPFLRFVTESVWASRHESPDVCDFVFGNPSEPPLVPFVEALHRSVIPGNVQWYGYKWSEPGAQEVIARTLRKRTGLPFEPADICMTNGAYAAISVTLRAILESGDEVVFLRPPWFFYEALIVAYEGRAVRVSIDDNTFDLDLNAIAAAITPRTRAVIVNSPHNPTGKIYRPETLAALASLLAAASARHGRRIFILSDEAYSRIVFDGAACHSPAEFYPDTFVIYTYAKTLLTPGQRIGYVALPPQMMDRDRLRLDLLTAQLVTGFAFPNALLQHALAELEDLSLDLEHLQRKRDGLVGALRSIGYDVHVPEGTFYLLPRAPGGDDVRFCERLEGVDVFCLPGTVVELPGYFRISLTANDEMIARALPRFAAAFQA